MTTAAYDFRDQIYVHLVDERDVLWWAGNDGTQSEGQVRDGRRATWDRKEDNDAISWQQYIEWTIPAIWFIVD